MVATKHQRRMNTHYLITGAAGFIGSYICRMLLEKEGTQSVVGIDNLNEYYSPKIKRFRLAELVKEKKFTFCNETVTDNRALRTIVAKHKPRVLIHTAAEVGVRSGEENPLRYFSTNVMGTMTVLETCKEYINHAIVFSSSSVYGNSSPVPFSESENIHLFTPISAYGASKMSMEVGTKNFFDRTGIATTIVRPFSVYGPNGRPDMLPIKLLISAIKQERIDVYSPSVLSRDWTYIEDFLHLFLALLDRPNTFRVVNLGSGKPLLLNDVIHIAEEIIRQRGLALKCSYKRALPAEMLQTWANNDKIMKLSKVKEFTSFKNGFTQTADFFFSHLDLYSV